MGPAYSRKGVQTPVWFSTTKIQQAAIYGSGPRAGSGAGTGSSVSLGEVDHRAYPSSQKEIPGSAAGTS